MSFYAVLRDPFTINSLLKAFNELDCVSHQDNYNLSIFVSPESNTVPVCSIQ